MRSKYHASIADPDGFWRGEAQRIDWIKPFTQVKDTSFDAGDFRIRWFADGTLNLSRQLPRPPSRRSAATRPRSSGSRTIRTRRPHPHLSPAARSDVCRFANLLKAEGVKRGDRVTIYLPMVPEAAVAMLACARIGAIHSVVFAGFTPEALGSRIEDCDSDVVITADEGLRGGKPIPLKANVDAALRPATATCAGVIVLKHTGADVPMSRAATSTGPTAVAGHSADARPRKWAPRTRCSSSTPPAATGKPKGVLHTTGGYLVWVGDDPRIRVRLPRAGRGLLVRGGHRLGHRPQLRRLRPAGQRRRPR